MRHFFFYFALAILFAHQMDAAANQEWQVLPVFDLMDDDWSYVVYVVLHIPVVAILVAWISSPTKRTRTLARLGVSSFLIAHAAFHVYYLQGQAGYQFESTLSRMLIYSGAVFAALHMLFATKDWVFRPRIKNK